LARAQIGEIQRTRILLAMAEACAERGAANVTVAHVVKRSGVSRRTFYELFDGCQDCFLVAVEDALEKLAERVLPAYERESRWRERMDATLTALLSYLEAEPAIGRLLAVETLGGGHAVLERRNRVFAQAVLAVGEGRRESKAGEDLPPLTAEGVVGGVMAVLQGRLLNHQPGSLLELKSQLMAMIVLPYLGRAAAQRELQRPVPQLQERLGSAPANPLYDLDMRLTYRTVRVLMALAARPDSSNREIALAADIADQGQTSKLLTRLHRLGLIENAGAGLARGGPNAWRLSSKGAGIERTISQQTGKPTLA
jgi:AcrR family transcriptional regulator